MVSDVKVLSVAPDDGMGEAVVLSAKILIEKDMGLEGYKFAELDENEKIYIKGESMQEKFESAGLKMRDTK